VKLMTNRKKMDATLTARKILTQLIKFLVSGVLIAILLHRIGPEEILQSVHKIRIEWLLMAIAIFSISHMIGSLQWWFLLKSQDISIPWKKTYGFYLVGLFFNNFLIGALGGDFFRVFDIKRYTQNSSAAISTVFLDRVIGLLVLSGLSVICSPWILIRGEQGKILFPLVILISVWIVILFLLFNQSCIRPFAWLVRKLLPLHITNIGKDIYQKIHGFGKIKKNVWIVVGISIVVQSSRILTHYFAGRSLGITISPVYFFIFIPMIAMIASLPISLGGIGFREQSGVILFSLVGVAAAEASLMEFLAYLVAIGSSLPGGLVFILRKKVMPSNQHLMNKNLDLGEI